MPEVVIIPETELDPVVEPMRPATAEIEPPTEPVVETVETTPPEPPIEHVLKFKANARTRIRAVIDGTKVKDFTLRAGESHSIKAFKSFELLISNAGGVEAFLDGEAMEPFGGLGVAKREKLTFGD